MKSRKEAMGNRLLLVILFILSAKHSNAVEMFGGLSEFLNYKSALPCRAESNNKNCEATQGLMGKALDEASQAGLEISDVIVKKRANDPEKIYIQSKKYGACLVETENQEQLGSLGFLCSSLGSIEKHHTKVDKVFALTKENNRYALLDVTEANKINGNL